MTAPKRLPPWHEHFRLPSGRELLIRPIRPEDAGPIQGAFALLGPDEVRHRFLYTLKELSPEMSLSQRQYPLEVEGMNPRSR